MCPSEPLHLISCSGIGKVIQALYRHQDETPPNKTLLKRIIDKWSKQIMGKSSYRNKSIDVGTPLLPCGEIFTLSLGDRVHGVFSFIFRTTRRTPEESTAAPPRTSSRRRAVASRSLGGRASASRSCKSRGQERL